MQVSNPNDAPPGVGTSYLAHLIALSNLIELIYKLDKIKG